MIQFYSTRSVEVLYKWIVCGGAFFFDQKERDI